ncbi:MAG TPA: SH3 domain-containing protein [Steroidobacteraceae bacterium]|nr:SH3 domain-containing protein [Steroidobacteraceae bacterium]
MRRWPTSLRTGLLRLAAVLLLAAPAAGMAADASAQQAGAQDKYLQLFISQPYLELHTGPGRGYPVAQVVGRGEAIDVLLRKTEWFKVRTERGVEGWANERDLVLAHLADGTLFVFKRGDRDTFTNHDWETGVFAGAYGGASMISAYESFSFNSQLKVEITLGQYLGNISNGYIAEIGLNHVFVPEWRLSPFITLGTGFDRVQPKVTLTQPLDSTNQTAYVGLGARFYLTRRFFLRADYRYHTVFTSRDQNEVNQEWKLGFAFFY